MFMMPLAMSREGGRGIVRSQETGRLTETSTWGRRVLEGVNMKIVTVFAATLFAAPALAHPGMSQGSSFVHDSLHLSGGMEALVLVAAIVAGIVAYRKSS
jgi:hypothetical protein